MVMVIDDVLVGLSISYQPYWGGVPLAYRSHHPIEGEGDHLDHSYHNTCSSFFHPSLALDLNLVVETPYLFPPVASEAPFLSQTPDRTPLEEAEGNDASQAHWMRQVHPHDDVELARIHLE
jgi:hypothetical protein